ncbi:MAG TPA: VOC family protein [Acidimicrobiales bacterium]|nr:VOC family protein [Acidimicrobiales bacterium]
MPSALGLDHIVLVVADVERSLAWYGRHAGLPAERVEAWRRGELPFPSLRIDPGTIIDLIPGRGDDGRGHLDHICLVVGADHQAALAADPDLEVVDRGMRSGARGDAYSIYVRDPDGLTVEFRSYDVTGG